MISSNNAGSPDSESGQDSQGRDLGGSDVFVWCESSNACVQNLAGCPHLTILGGVHKASYDVSVQTYHDSRGVFSLEKSFKHLKNIMDCN